VNFFLSALPVLRATNFTVCCHQTNLMCGRRNIFLLLPLAASLFLSNGSGWNYKIHTVNVLDDTIGFLF
jgi:hypothetical protein